MIPSIIILIIVSIIAWIITYIQEKYKIVAIILTFLSIASLLLGFLTYFTDYDPLKKLKEIAQNEIYENKQKSTQEQPMPLEVYIPDSANHTSKQTNEEFEKSQQVDFFTKPIILNIDDTVYRNDEDKIHIVWTPIVDQENYWIKVKVDDPFISSETESEYKCKNTWYDIDVSKYPYDTVMFVSIGIWDKENSQKVYSDPISFNLY